MSPKRARRQRGATIVLFAICIVLLVCIIALVVDIGRLYVAKQRAQNVADATVIGGAWLLDGTASSEGPALAEVDVLAAANNQRTTDWKVIGLTDDSEGVTSMVLPEGAIVPLGDGSTTTVGPYRAVQVQCRVKVEFIFAPIMNRFVSRPSATAIAMWKAIDTLRYPSVPWAVPVPRIPTDPDEHPEMTLKVTHHNDPDAFIGPGNFLALDYGSGAATYRDYVDGYPRGEPVPPVYLEVGGPVSPETGNIIGPTNQGVSRRLARDSVFPSPSHDETAWEEWLATGAGDGTYEFTPRIVVVPVVEDPVDLIPGSSEDLTVAGFAAFFIESYEKGGEVTGRFICATLQGGELVFGTTSLAEPGAAGTITTVRLVNLPDQEASMP